MHVHSNAEINSVNIWTFISNSTIQMLPLRYTEISEHTPHQILHVLERMCRKVQGLNISNTASIVSSCSKSRPSRSLIWEYFETVTEKEVHCKVVSATKHVVWLSCESLAMRDYQARNSSHVVNYLIKSTTCFSTSMTVVLNCWGTHIHTQTTYTRRNFSENITYSLVRSLTVVGHPVEHNEHACYVHQSYLAIWDNQVACPRNGHMRISTYSLWDNLYT